MAISKPNPPQNVKYTSMDDWSQIDVSWQSAADSSRPWSKILVGRRLSVAPAAWGKWANVQSLASTVSNTSLRDALPNGRYQATIYAQNGAGDSTHVDSPVIYTQPDAPKKVEAKFVSSGNVEIAVDATNTYGWSVSVERLDPGSQEWTEIASGVQGVNVVVRDTPPAGMLKYRARVFRYVYGNGDTSYGDRGIYGPYTESNQVTSQADPLPPTVTSPTQGQVFGTGNDATIVWTLNHPDGNPQTHVEIEYTVANAAGTHTGSIVEETSAQYYNMPLDVEAEYTIRVRTQGWGNWSDWSDYVTFRASSGPDVTITQPTASTVIDHYPIDLRWNVVSDVPIVSQQVFAVVMADTSYNHTYVDVSASDRAARITASDLPLENGNPVAFHVEAVDAHGIPSYAEVRCTVQFQLPPVPKVTASEGHSKSLAVVVDYNNQGANVPTTRAEVYRVDMAGNLTFLGVTTESGHSVNDMLAPLNTDVDYRVGVFSDFGGVRWIDFTGRLESNTNVLNFGPHAEAVLEMGTAQSVSRESTHEMESFDFADGSPLPVSYPTGAQSRRITTTDRRAFDQDVLHFIEETAQAYSFAYFRDAAGFRDYVAFTMTTSYDVTESPRTMETHLDMVVQAWQDPR